jgi:hypothetical protein
MADLRIDPLVQTPKFRETKDPEIRKQILQLWTDPATTDTDREAMLQHLGGSTLTASGYPVTPPGMPSVEEETLQEGITKPSTLLPLAMGAVSIPATPAIAALPGMSRVSPIITRPLVEGGMQAMGELTGQTMETGKPPTIGDVVKSTALNILPSAAEEAVRGVSRNVMRNLPGGQRIRFDEAATQARALPEEVFQPRPAAEISQAFQAVRATGMPIDTTDLAQHLQTLAPGKQADVLNTLTKLDRDNKTGGRYAQLYQDVLAGQNVTRNIGDLQNLRSLLRQEADSLRGVPEARKLVRDLQSAVDHTIDTGLASGVSTTAAQATRDLLHTARQDWARHSAAEEMSHMVEDKIRSTPDLKMSAFNLRAFYDELRKGNSEISKTVNRALDLTPGARQRFESEIDEIAKLFETIEMPLADVTGWRRSAVIAGIGQNLSSLMLTDTGRKWVRGAVIAGRGELSPNAVAMAANAIWRGGREQPRREEPSAALSLTPQAQPGVPGI